MTVRQQVREIAHKIILDHPTGIHWSELVRSVRAQLPAENRNTIVGGLHAFQKNLPPGIVRPERGIYAAGGAADEEPIEGRAFTNLRFNEQSFYQPFADWLVDELEEATKAKPIGGNGAGGKWGTPDVLGLLQPRRTDPIQFTEEVIAAEIKVDTQGLIVAFGQACAYKLFAHRVYIVVPRTANEKDLKRLDALAGVVGIGLVKFSPEDPQNPEFTVMVRAARNEPDYFYTNDVLSKFKDELEL